MLLQLIGSLQSFFQRIYHDLLTFLILLAVLIVVANHFGWLDRWIWFVLESEAQKTMNGALCTLGSFTVDWTEILQGKITLHASNVVIHTPQKSEWKWDSPLIARIGKATVECNAVITVFHAVFLCRDVPIEAYTILIADVQVFVERRDSLLNVFLLNPTIQLPQPPGKIQGKSRNDVKADGDTNFKNDNHHLLSSHTKKELTCAISNSEFVEKPILSHVQVPNALQPVQEESINNLDGTGFIKGGDTNLSIEGSNDHNHKAKVLVNEMLHAVQVLGGAAARGKLSGAIKQQGLELVNKLQGFREQENNLEEGIRVMQQLGKVGVESLQSAQKLILPTPDTSKEENKKIVYIRVGRIVIDDIRIFTKDSWINAITINDIDGLSNASSLGTTALTSNKPITTNAGTKEKVISKIEQNGRWNKPIYIERMVLRSSELSPSMSMTDDNNLPTIYQSVDKVGEIVSRRLLVEIAKTNTGKLFSTAIGEVLSVMVSNPNNSLPSTSKNVTTTNI